jgi:hypothetical protein
MLATWFLSSTSFAVDVNATGSILRDTSINYFDLSIKVTDISKTTQTSKEKDLFKDRIRVWLTDLSSANTEYVPFEGDPAVAAVPFTIKLRSDLVQTPNEKNLTDFTYNVRIYASNPGTYSLKKLLDDKGSGTTVKLKVSYYEDLSEQAKKEGISISVNTAIVQDAPAGTIVKGTHKALVINWTPPTTVTWSDNTSAAPTGIVALAIDKSTTTTNIPAYIYDKTAASDAEAADGTCVFIPDFTEGTSCISCSNSNAYLNPTKLETLSTSGIFSSSGDTSDGKGTVTGLTNDKPYAVLLFYQPGGLNRTTCVTGTPTKNTTYSELNGEKEAPLLDPKCFIATAAYGSPLHKNLKPLRWFRDKILLSTTLGRHFVEWYYEHGPRAAKVVAANPTLQIAVRALLWIPTIVLSLWMYLAGLFSPLSPTLMVAIAGSLAAAGYLAKKFRGVA